LGTAIEPVTRRPRSWSPATRLAIVFNMAASAALIVAGWHHLAAAQTRSPERADLGTRARPLRASATHAESALGIPEVGHATPRNRPCPCRCASSRRSGGASRSADMPTEPHTNGRSVASAYANTHRLITGAARQRGHWRRASGMKSMPKDVITDRYPVLAVGPPSVQGVQGSPYE
jgi:hypothetical protein